MELQEKIFTRRAELSIIGMGYVGLPLAVEFIRGGFSVHGIDIDRQKVAALREGRSHVVDLKDDVLSKALETGRFKLHERYDAVARADCVIICVPTPLRKTGDPDIGFIMSAAREIKPHLHAGMLIVLESTTYPGTTEELLLQELHSDNLVVGKDLFLAFSPERVDPGNPVYNTRNTPKIVGGLTPKCTEIARALYEQAVDRVVTVSSASTAEMVKLLENTFRAVNIGLVNEIAIMCDKLGVPVWEVIEAAATKPFGFMPFFPGPGLGGHCIPIDPIYLSWKLKMLNYNARFIDLASEINTHMPDYCVNKIARALNSRRKCVNGSRILVLGVSYKKDIDDTRESPALDIIRLLQSEGGEVDFSDPLVPELNFDGESLKSVELNEEMIRQYDVVVMVTNHSCFDYELIGKSAQLIFDGRNAFPSGNPNVVKL